MSLHYLQTVHVTCHADDGHELACNSSGQHDRRIPNRRELRSVLNLQTKLLALTQ